MKNLFFCGIWVLETDGVSLLSLLVDVLIILFITLKKILDGTLKEYKKNQV